MRSMVVYTEEIDDLELAAEELATKLSAGLPLMKNTCGILFCEMDTDPDELMRELADRFDFPVMGTTALTTFSKNYGYCETGISMLVLTADDCAFSMASTDDLDGENYQEQLEEAYHQAQSALPEKEKLIITYSCKLELMPNDLLITHLNELSGGVPVYGGLASDNLTWQDFRVFYGGKKGRQSTTILLISGNVKPIFKVEFSLNRLSDFSAEITRSEFNKVYELDGLPFDEAMQKAGFIAGAMPEGDCVMDFISTPFMFVETLPDGTKHRFMRNLSFYDPEERSGLFLLAVPQGAQIQSGLMRREDVQESVKKAFESVLEEINAAQDYHYSTLICTSCCVRYLVMATEPDAEVKAYEGLLPDNIDLIGYSSFGEFCPSVTDSGAIFNGTYNDTFTILAF